jgi:hypothetical protein
VGTLEKLVHPEGAESYQWSTPRLAGSTRDEVLDAVVAACQAGDLPSGDAQLIALDDRSSLV